MVEKLRESVEPALSIVPPLHVVEKEESELQPEQGVTELLPELQVAGAASRLTRAYDVRNSLPENPASHAFEDEAMRNLVNVLANTKGAVEVLYQQQPQPEKIVKPTKHPVIVYLRDSVRNTKQKLVNIRKGGD